MNNFIRSFLITLLILFSITACSRSTLQSGRLDTAEGYIIDAERALSGTPDSNAIRFADESLGTANAYLLTLRDHKKYLNDNELKRYHALKKRTEDLMKGIGRPQ